MAKRVYPTKTERSREILVKALKEHQDANPGDNLETAFSALSSSVRKTYIETLDMTNSCANTYFQNRKKELESSLKSITVTSESAPVETAAAA